MPVTSYKDLVVWQKAMDLVVETYTLMEQYPLDEKYGLISQSKRAAVSIPANIAEGRRRGSKKDFAQFLRIAFGSGAELETHFEIAKRLSWGKKLDFRAVDQLLLETMKMLNTMIHNLQAKP